MLDVRDADAQRRVGAIEDKADLPALVAKLLCDLQEEAHILDTRDFETEHRKDHIGGIQDRERRVVEERRAVDDHQVMRCPQRLQDLPDPFRRHQLRHLGGRRCEQDADARRVIDDERVDGLDLAAGCLDLRHQVCDRFALGIEVEQHADVAELERAVHDDDPLAELRCGGDREVDGHRRAADAALGAEDRDDKPGLAFSACDLAAAARRGCRGHGQATLLVALTGADLSDGGRQLIAAEGFDQELTCAGQHGAAEIVGFTLDGHHDDRGSGDDRAELLRRRDPVHVRHVDVHQDHIGMEANGHLQRLASGCRGADHIHVAFEAEQLRQVIAGLRDVVHD